MLKAFLLGWIRFYRRVLSPLKGAPSCRYLPTCSEYALAAIEERGALRGALAAAGRILRCNPFFPGGYDPVKRSGEERADREAARVVSGGAG